jgi:hypothetical protein
VEKGLISEDFYNSGVLDAFDIDESTQEDELVHILVGNTQGGAHHLPTIVSLGIENVAVASTIYDPERPNKSPGDFRREQRVKDNGVYKALDVKILDRDGSVSRKDGGSSMFPNEWSTQKVLAAVYATSKAPGEHDVKRDAYRHETEVEGVKVVAYTDDKTGKIFQAWPKSRKG